MSSPSQLSNEKKFFSNNKNVATNLIHAIMPHKFTSIGSNNKTNETNKANPNLATIMLTSAKTPYNSFNESFSSSSGSAREYLNSTSSPKSLKSFNLSSIDSLNSKIVEDKLLKSPTGSTAANKNTENILKIGINSYSISPIMSNNNNYNQSYMTELKIDPNVLSNVISSDRKIMKTYNKTQVRSSVKSLCDNMKKQILSRAFYGWLLYHRHFKTVSVRLIGLINCDRDCITEDEDDDQSEYQSQLDNISISSEMSIDLLNSDPYVKSSMPLWYLLNRKKLDETLWSNLMEENKLQKNKTLFYKIIYYNGIENNKLRREVWPYLMEHYSISMNEKERNLKDEKTRENYFKLIDEWKPFEEFIHVREQKKMDKNLMEMEQNRLKVAAAAAAAAAANSSTTTSNLIESQEQSSNQVINTKSSTSKSSFKLNLLGRNNFKTFTNTKKLDLLRTDSNQSNNDVFDDDSESSSTQKSNNQRKPSLFSKFSAMNLFNKLMSKNENNIDEESQINTNDGVKFDNNNNETKTDLNESQNENEIAKLIVKNVILKAQIKFKQELEAESSNKEIEQENELKDNENNNNHNNRELIHTNSSNNLLFKNSMKRSLSNHQLVDTFSLNMHRIDKDVTRCDRNYWYFVSVDNLKKLKNIIYT